MTLQEQDLKLLNKQQRDIVKTQWDLHQHPTHTVNYDVTGEQEYLESFEVHAGVFCPFKSSARFHVHHLFYNNALFRDKKAIEMGCGTGLASVVMAKYGASKVIATDISPSAVKNTRANAEQYGLSDKVEVKQGHLFENIDGKVDLINWNIPFFPGEKETYDTITRSMMMTDDTFSAFLDQAKNYLNDGGVLHIPSYSIGGERTDPRKVGPKHGYSVDTVWTHKPSNGIQEGTHYIHLLRLPQ